MQNYLKEYPTTEDHNNPANKMLTQENNGIQTIIISFNKTAGLIPTEVDECFHC